MGSGYYSLFPTVFQPRAALIIAITNANPAVVTTSIDSVNPGVNNYITGTVVRLDIPPQFGMFQANQLFGTIIVLTSTTFSITIDTTLFDAFVGAIAIASPSCNICTSCSHWGR